MSRLSILIGTSGAGELVGGDVGFGEALGAEMTFTPLFHKVFFPTLMQVNFVAPTIFTVPALTHGAPAFTDAAVAAEPISSVVISASAARIPKVLFIFPPPIKLAHFNRPVVSRTQTFG
jgi:hypothetical protein